MYFSELIIMKNRYLAITITAGLVLISSGCANQTQTAADFGNSVRQMTEQQIRHECSLIAGYERGLGRRPGQAEQYAGGTSQRCCQAQRRRSPGDDQPRQFEPVAGGVERDFQGN